MWRYDAPFCRKCPHMIGETRRSERKSVGDMAESRWNPNQGHLSSRLVHVTGLVCVSFSLLAFCCGDECPPVGPNLDLVITTSSPLPGGTVDEAFSETLEASGGSGSYIWSLVGSDTLPTGLVRNGRSMPGRRAASMSHVHPKKRLSANTGARRSVSRAVPAPHSA